MPYFRDSQYRDLDIAATLVFYRKRFVNQLSHFRGVTNKTGIADVGCGCGWLFMTYCIEVLEHVSQDITALRELSRVTDQCVILTTPNNWFPVGSHDSQLPLIHWLPVSWRQIYARLLGRQVRSIVNLYDAKFAVGL